MAAGGTDENNFLHFVAWGETIVGLALVTNQRKRTGWRLSDEKIDDAIDPTCR